MAQRVVGCIVGADVSKKTFQSYSIANEREAIERWLA
jgi:hypothetical protein